LLIVPLNIADEEVMNVANKYYDELKAAGVDVLMDDRKARPGFKFKDADLIGIPLRMVIGGKGLKEGNVEMKWRTGDGPELVPVENAVSGILDRLNERRAAEAANVPE
jgi:prolyl-tRNA synthetase